ncbi:hypothetical protein LTS06_011862, partial [Exophiala xenobiotica]
NVLHGRILVFAMLEPLDWQTLIEEQKSQTPAVQLNTNSSIARGPHNSRSWTLSSTEPGVTDLHLQSPTYQGPSYQDKDEMASTPSMCVLARLRTKIRQTEGFITDLDQARPLREIARSCGLSSNIVTHRIAVYNKRMTEIALVMLNSNAGACAGVSTPICRPFTQTQAHDVFVDAMVKNMMGLSMKEALWEAAQEEIERVDTEEDSLFRMFGIWPARIRRIEVDGQLW